MMIKEREVLSCPFVMMYAATPDGVPQRQIGDKMQKNFFSAVLCEALIRGVLHREDIFHCLGVNRIDSCLFLQ
jgi:hypothetical protein